MIELELSKRKFFDLSKTEEERALELHQKAVVVDALACINPGRMPLDYRWFKEIKEAGVTASNLTTVYPQQCTYDFRSTVETIFRWYDLLEKTSQFVAGSFATSAQDILKAKEARTHALILGFQDTAPIEDDLYLASILHRLGTRIVQLTYNERNLVGDGCNERTDCGLSRFGMELVGEMNRLGILVDLSHCGHRTTMETIEISKDPVSFTHVGARSICDNRRNKTDEEMKALAEKNGVLGVVEWSPLVQVKKGVRPTVEDYIVHIDYVVDLVGVDHVGLGLDLSYGELTTEEEWEQLRRKYPDICGPFTFYTRRSEGLEIISGVINITRGLVAKGYSDQEILSILGGNFLRLFRTVWGK